MNNTRTKPRSRAPKMARKTDVRTKKGANANN